MSGRVTQTVRPVRCDSILPTKLQDFSRISQLVQLYRRLWAQAPQKSTPADIDLLRVYVSMMLDSAISHSAALDCIMKLRASDWQPGGPIEISIHRKEQTDRVVRLNLHKTTELAVQQWQGGQLWWQAESDIRPNRLFAKLEKSLRNEFDQALSFWGPPCQLAFGDIRKLAPFLAVENGAEPFLNVALDSRVRPTSQPLDDTYMLDGVSRESLNHILRTLRPGIVQAKPPRTEENSDQGAEMVPSSAWIGESRKLLRLLCAELKSANSRRLRTPRQQQNAREILQRYVEQAKSMAPEDSAVVLAIEYAESCYVNNPTITAGTLRDYLDRTIINGLLDSEASYSLADWDPDDFVEVVEDRLSNPRLNGTTRRLILDAFAPLLKFLTRKLNLPVISISALRGDYVAGSGHSSLISSHAIDKVISSLYADTRREVQQAAIIIVLCYYGGLRASEARRLTLDNVVFSDRLENLDIEVLRGKSESSR